MSWLAGWHDAMDPAADFLDARAVSGMTAWEDPTPGGRSGPALSRAQRLLKTPWKRLVTAEDLFPLAQLAFFLLLPPPLDGLVWALLAVLGTVMVLRIWQRCRTAEN